MKNKTKTVRPGPLFPSQTARFLAGSVTTKLCRFSVNMPNAGDTCKLWTIDSEEFAPGSNQALLATVTLTEVIAAALDTDLLIVGQVRMAPDSPEALVFANDCGYNSFASLADSFHGRLPFIGHVLRWPPYSLKSPQAGPTVSGQGQDAIPA